jgi:glyoxylase-like metal-dependent hydrolase (beta-lactamase superfamily II)
MFSTRIAFIPAITLAGLLLLGCEASGPKVIAVATANQSQASVNDHNLALKELLATAKRIPNSTGWFEILKLPNSVYALWEPGHAEKVNAFYVLGETRDLLYDTGMGIANIATAIADLRAFEQLPSRQLMVINSHNHLDHNGGNMHFPNVWVIDHPWAIRRLTLGVPGGAEAGFVPYWNQLTPHPGVQPPEDFDPETHAIAPYLRENIHFLADGDMVDLGNRQFRVLQMSSHSPDGLALYDAEHELFFGGDTFYGSDYLIVDLKLLATDLTRTEHLPITWHYASHGPQLIETMQHGKHLAVVRRMLADEGIRGTTQFAGLEMPMIELDGVRVTLAGEVLLY